MVNANWPLTVTSVALSTDPFDAAATPSYVDISSRVREFGAASGRQYELDTVQAGEASFVVTDRDEAFNPTNPSSPYYPNVLPYRQIADQAMWPPAPLGGAVNLLVGQLSPLLDPTFESYTNGATPSWILTTGGVTPTVTTTNPQQGTKSLTYTVTSGGGEQGVGVIVTTIPGQQYTGSLFLRQTAANTSQIFINGGVGGTSTTTTGSYVRLSVTFTASRTSHQLWVVSFTTPNSGTVNIDAIQVEPGASASTFSSAAGPVIYGNFAGFVERWPSKWNHQGAYGVAEITAVDGFAILAGQQLGTELRNAILAKTPDYYWPFDEPQGATTFVEASGSGGPALTRMDGPYGPGPTFAAGAQTNIPGDPSGTGLASNTNGVGTNVPASVAQAGLKLGGASISFGGSATLNWSCAFVLSRTTPTTPGGQTEVGITLTQSTGARLSLDLFQFYTDSTPDHVHVLAQAPGPSSVSINVSPDIWTDGKPHIYVITGTISATTVTINLWVDGALFATNSSATVSGFTSPFLMDTIEVGGFLVPKTLDAAAAITNGVYSHVALWTRVLGNQEILDLNYALGGYVNEGSGARIIRYLSYNWTGGTAIDAGTSSMGVSDLANNTSILDAVLSVTQSEGGVSFVDDTGTITFQGRGRRFTNTTPTWSLGEQESPYEADIAYDYDPTLIFNDPEVTRSGGVTAVGGTLTARQASWKRYGKRSYTITINVASDLETQDRANWIFSTHKDPLQRIATLTLKPSANPALWPVCLGARISDRATVKRRTTAGYTMSSDYFIERIEQRRTPTEWTFTFQMSPAAATGQPWILGDATYGILDTSTILGF